MPFAEDSKQKMDAPRWSPSACLYPSGQSATSSTSVTLKRYRHHRAHDTHLHRLG